IVLNCVLTLHDALPIFDDLGCAAAIDYKSENVEARLQALCPNGIDIYFDNAGGPILDAALGHIAEGARIVVCGATSQYAQQGNRSEEHTSELQSRDNLV